MDPHCNPSEQIPQEKNRKIVAFVKGLRPFQP